MSFVYLLLWIPHTNPTNCVWGQQDSWEICRIFKKANSMAQRAFSHSWVSSCPEIAASDILIEGQGGQFTQFSTEIKPAIRFCTSAHLQQQTSNVSYNKPSNFPFSNGEIPNNGFVFSSPEISGTTTTSSKVDATSILLNPEFQSPEHQFGGGFSITLPQDVRIGQDEQPGLKKKRKNLGSFEDSNQWEAIRFPFTLEADFVMGFTALS